MQKINLQNKNTLIIGIILIIVSLIVGIFGTPTSESFYCPDSFLSSSSYRQNLHSTVS